MENTVSSFKEDVRTFSESNYFFKKIEFQYWKEDCQTYTKKVNFKPQIKPIIENLQDKLYQLENKQTKTLLTMFQNFL